MTKFYVIPDRKNMDVSLELAKEYNLGFEFDDFWLPDTLSDESKVNGIASFYSDFDLPDDISVHGDFFDVCIFSIDREIAEISERRIWQSMEAAHLMGAKKAIFHSNINSLLAHGFYLDNWLSKNKEFFGKVCAKYPDIEVLMENMFDENPGPMAKLAKMMEDVPNFNICFDYAHAAISPTPTAEWVKELAPYIRHVHINDNNGKEDSHLAIGKGVTDWEEFLALKNEYFADASVLIEISDINEQKDSLRYMKEKSFF